ncbi:MAG: hypothetical protein KF732_11840 [Flavobacteriales bacterium]|nr:hypothetical protein [Flavobacteriales bacterium]
METGINKYVRHTYKISKELKSYTVYDLEDVNNPNKLLTDTIRIEPFLNYSNADNFNDYLRIKNHSNWKFSSLITGLKPTSTKNLFFGDCAKPNLLGNTKKSLLLFYFDNDKGTLIIDVFRDYYPYNNSLLENQLKQFKID